MKIRFVRLGLKKSNAPVKVSNQRLSAARRAIQRHNDKVALFPEWHDKTTPEERAQQSVDGVLDGIVEFRDKTCRAWREARVMLRAMTTEDRNRFLGYWNTCGMPGTSDWLVMTIKRYQKGEIDIEGRIGELRKIRRLGYEKIGIKDPKWEWLPIGDPATDETDPRIIKDVLESD